MNIFIANIHFDVDDEELKNLFAGYGEVDSAKIIYNRDTQRSKGYGFVEMPNDDEANKAINELNGTELQGRPIVVKKAKPRV
jgi:RNA recognition motif-containing protein